MRPDPEGDKCRGVLIEQTRRRIKDPNSGHNAPSWVRQITTGSPGSLASILLIEF
jgi:hypothetical protein